MINKVMGVDLGFSTSPTCVAVLENVDTPEFNKIKYVIQINPISGFFNHENDKILTRKLVLSSLSYIINIEKPTLIVLERPLLQGIGNVDFSKFLGIFEDKIIEYPYTYIAPTSVKKYMGDGRMEKEEIAQALLNLFKDKKDIKLIKKAIESKSWDITDSIAIAYAGHLRSLET